MKNRVFAALTGLAMGFVPVSCRAATPLDASDSVFRFRLPFEPATFDWALGDVPIPVIQNIHRGLFRVDQKGNVVPDLVSSIKRSWDGKKWTFKLKPKLRWSNGSPLLASEIIDSWTRLLSPKTASSYAYFLFPIRGARDFAAGKPEARLEMRAVGVDTIELLLEEPIAFFPAILTHWVTFPVRTEEWKKDPKLFLHPERVSVLGAFRISDYQTGARVVLLPNPYAETPPRLKRVEALLVTDDSSALALYESGKLDLISDPGEGATKHPDLHFSTSPILTFIGLGPGHPLTQDPRAVAALSAALDRSELPAALGAPHRATTSLVPPEFWPTPGAPSILRSLASPQAIPQDLRVPAIRLRFFQRPLIRQTAEWIQAQWKKHLGLNVELLGSETKSYWAELRAEKAAFFLNTKGASYPDADTYFRLFQDLNSQNMGVWSDATFTEMVRQAASHGVAQQRSELYRKASERLLVEKPAIIPLFFRANTYLLKPRVRDFRINPLTSIDLSRVELRP